MRCVVARVPVSGAPPRTRAAQPSSPSSSSATRLSIAAELHGASSSVARTPYAVSAVSGAGSSRRDPQRALQVVAHQPRVERSPPRERRGGVGAGRRRRDEPAAVRERLQLRQTVVLTAGCADEHARSAQQGAKHGGQAPRHPHTLLLHRQARAGEHQLLLRAPRAAMQDRTRSVPFLWGLAT